MIESHVLNDHLAHDLKLLNEFLAIGVEFVELSLQPIQELDKEPQGQEWVVTYQHDIPLKVGLRYFESSSHEFTQKLILPLSKVGIK